MAGPHHRGAAAQELGLLVRLPRQHPLLQGAGWGGWGEVDNGSTVLNRTSGKVDNEGARSSLPNLLPPLWLLPTCASRFMRSRP